MIAPNLSYIMEPMTQNAIRGAALDDLPFLWEMLQESAFLTDEVRAQRRATPERPSELRKYLDGWGRPADVGLIALDKHGCPIGAAWYRQFEPAQRGDGILAHRGVPEIAIALTPEARGHGTGGALLEALCRQAAADGYKSLMLSVDPANERALRLYRRLGFVVMETTDVAAGTSLIMTIGL